MPVVSDTPNPKLTQENSRMSLLSDAYETEILGFDKSKEIEKICNSMFYERRATVLGVI